MSELSYGAIHLRATDRVALIEDLHAVMGANDYRFRPGGKDAEARNARRFLLMPPSGGWTTLLPEDPTWTRALAKDLATAGTPCLAVVHVDGDLAFAYEAYGKGGELIDAYHSCPDAEKGFDEADTSEAELERTRGNPAKLASAFGLAAERFEAVATVLKDARIPNLRDHSPSLAKYADAEEPRRILIEALGLPLEEEGFPELWELGLFEESEVELRALVYGPTKENKGRLRGFLDRFRGDEDEDEDDEGEDEDGDDDDLKDEDEDLEDSRDG